MIELLIQILRFAAESPQNALVVIGFFGAFGMFAPKMQPPKVSEQRRETPRNAKGRGKRTARKVRAVQKPKKQKKAKAKGWFEAPPLSQHEQDLWLNYKIKRDFSI